MALLRKRSLRQLRKAMGNTKDIGDATQTKGIANTIYCKNPLRSHVSTYEEMFSVDDGTDTSESANESKTQNLPDGDKSVIDINRDIKRISKIEI